MNVLNKPLVKTTIGLIKLYQKTLSPDHSFVGKLFPYRGCKFHPTCSMYAIECFEKKGFAKGLGLSLRRLGKCHPWSNGGIDFPKK